jgi:peptidoglycan/xylan/chitin deacetylase (PgdA/CDA1 family)
MTKILLSFDLEEFDIPEEFGDTMTEAQKLSVTVDGMKVLLAVLERQQVTATFFTTAFFAEAHPELIRLISSNHEIASHGFYHSSFEPGDIVKSKKSLEQITGLLVTGFRMARMVPLDETLLAKAGYTYNASLNPTFIPGRYNNLRKPRLPFQASGLVHLPASVALWFRVPLFWISFKVLPFSIYKRLALRVLKKDNYLNIYFHPWEFTDISNFKIPSYTKTICGPELTRRFENLISFLKDHGQFVRSHDYSSDYLKLQKNSYEG